MCTYCLDYRPIKEIDSEGQTVIICYKSYRIIPYEST